MVDFLVYIATMVAIWGILALSLNLQYGIAGLVNLGHIVFFLIGAYASASFVLLLGLPFLVGVAGAVALAALFGALMALPTAHLQQDYWAISTLAAAEIVRIVMLNTQLGGPYTGGAYGIDGIPQPLRGLVDSGDTYGWLYLGFAAAALLACYAIVQWLIHTPFGRALKALREGDDVPLALGKDPRGLRIRGMAIGGALGGLAGALFAHYNTFIEPRYFMPLETFIIWAMVILGGAGNFRGAIVGAVIIQALYNGTRFLGNDIEIIDADVMAALRMIIIGLLVVAVILFMPRGLIPEPRRRYGSGDTSAG